MKKTFVLTSLLVASTLISAIFLLRASASGSGQINTPSTPTAPVMIFTVNNTNDDGVGSLRDAINQANATPGADVINFDIGVGTPTIDVGSLGLGPLPVITEAVTINGATGGATRVELNGTMAGLGGSDGLSIMTGNCIIRALVINRFSGSGIVISGGSGNVVQGNFIGTDVNGTAALDNALNGVVIDFASSNNTVGGTAAGAGNVISGNAGAGIAIGSATGNVIQGNFIGTDVTGVAPLGNGSGIRIIGGGTDNTIGGTIAGAPNRIAFNTSAGVLIGGGIQNAVLSNSIFSNGGLGINLSDDPSITPNDPCDGDGGANNIQNFPDLTSASQSGGNTVLQGSLNSTASMQFRIEFFANAVCDGSGNGEGETFIGSSVVMTDPACVAPINVSLPVSVPVGQFITATATDLQNNTSEFSACVPVSAAACTISCPANITRSNDPGACGAELTYPAPMITGACGAVTCNPPSGSFFPIGPTTVTCTTGAGPMCAFTVTINDTQLPTITCPANQTTPATNPSGAPVNYPPPTISDNCSGPTAACVPPTGSTFPVGATMVNCTATDASNNQSTCNFTVTVTAQSDLAITKNGSPNPVGSGANLTYSIAVNNAGPSAATGVTVTDMVPAGTTFVSVAPSQGTFTAPPPGGTGQVTCSLGSIAFGGSATISLVVQVNAAPGSTITNTASVTSTSNDPGLGNNSATAMTLVSFVPCSVSCPADVTANTLPLPFGCGAPVSYPTPTTIGPCGGVACVPSSSSFFAVGVTPVTCTAEDGPSCSFNVTVKDTTAPRITCSGNISTSAPPGQNSVVVTYSAPLVVDNCSSPAPTCAPPSGSAFPIGTSMVTCTATDAADNTSTCSFSVTVRDTQAPTITCPSPVAVNIPAGQCQAVVNFPPPTVTDNVPGTTVTCTPPSGSTFPLGITTVNCAAFDPTGNRATCAFTVTVQRSPSPGNEQTITLGFGGRTPVPPVRKAKKNPPASCECSVFFSIPNTGCGVLGLDLLSISRTGSDVASGRITNPDDSKFFSLRIVNPDGSERPFPELCTGACIQIAPGQSQTFRVVFSPVVPAPSGKTTGLAASQVLPNTVTSKITFSTSQGGNLTIDLIAHVGTALQLINASNPKKGASASFTKSGNQFILTYAVFDSNLDTNRAKYELLDQTGALVGQAIEVDLAGPIVDGRVFKGQSFVVEQMFSGANSHSEITSLRLTVFDAESSDSLTTELGSSANAAGIVADTSARPVTLKPRTFKLSRSRP